MAKLPVSGQQTFDDIDPNEHIMLIQIYSNLPAVQIALIDARAMSLRKTHHIPLLFAVLRSIKEILGELSPE